MRKLEEHNWLEKSKNNLSKDKRIENIIVHPVI